MKFIGQEHAFLVTLSVCTVLFGTCPRYVHAREITYGKAKETLSVAFGVETLFRFPMEVKTITEAQRFEIKPSNAEEPDYSVLVVKPRMSQGISDVAFILSDGSVIRTQLVISNQTHKKQDAIYDFKPKDELASSNPNLLDQREPLTISELDLMRAMVGGDRISGFESRAVSIPIGTVSEDLSAELVTIYRSSASGLQGFVYRLKTPLKERSISISLENLAIGQPNLALLAQVDRPSLGGQAEEGRETYLRIVAKPGAAARKMILPTAIKLPSGERKTSEEKSHE